MTNSNMPAKTPKPHTEFNPTLVNWVQTSPRPSPTLLVALQPHDKTYVRLDHDTLIEMLRASLIDRYRASASAMDTVPNTKVAIKRMSSFKHQTYCQRTLKEIKTLNKLKHENTIDTRDILPPPTIHLHDFGLPLYRFLKYHS